VDLNELIARRYDTMGEAKVETMFADKNTHTTKAGAELNAEMVTSGLRSLPNAPLDSFLSGKGREVPAASL
jgi:hypothetical protein